MYKNEINYKSDIGAFIGLNYNIIINDNIKIPIFINFQKGFKNIKIYDDEKERYTTTLFF